MPFRLDRLAYRNAELTHTYDCGHSPEYHQYPPKPLFRIYLRHEGRRHSLGNRLGTMGRTDNRPFADIQELSFTAVCHEHTDSIQERRHSAILQSQPRHLLPHAVSHSHTLLLHISRSEVRHGRACRQHPPHAAVHTLQLFHGWFRLCRRGYGRQGIRP